MQADPQCARWESSSPKGDAQRPRGGLAAQGDLPDTWRQDAGGVHGECKGPAFHQALVGRCRHCRPRRYCISLWWGDVLDSASYEESGIAGHCTVGQCLSICTGTTLGCGRCDEFV